MTNKTIKNMLIISIIFAALIMLVISQNTYHIDICDDDNCHECILIQISQTIIHMLRGIIILLSIEIISCNISYKLKELHYENILNSLVFQKVQLNE